jgi:hypothetical protein
MGAAEIILFEDVRASKPWDTLRQQLHKRFAQWLNTLEQQWHELPSAFTEVTTTVWDVRQQLTGSITETNMAHVHRSVHDRTQAHCPRCAVVLKVGDLVCRTVAILVGPVWLERPYVSCRACRFGHYPFDAAVGVVPGCKQLDMQKAAAQLVTTVPYDAASRFATI